MTRTPAVMEMELKPCPFCGGEALMHRVPWGWQVTCHDCGAAPRNNSNSNRETETEAGAVWNRRTPAEPLADGEMIEALFSFLCRKYVQRSDGRQTTMGLQYMEAETHDLAKTIATFMAGRVPAYNPNDRLREALEEAWTDFLDANPDDLNSPEEYPDHALVTFKQLVGIVDAALYLIRIEP